MRKYFTDIIRRAVILCLTATVISGMIPYTADAYADDISQEIATKENIVSEKTQDVKDAEAKYEKEKSDAEAKITVKDSEIPNAGREFIDSLVKEAYAADKKDSSITNLAALSKLTIKGRMAQARKNESLAPIIEKLDSSSLSDYTFEGLVNRSLSLSNLRIAISYMEKCNAYRTEYNNEKNKDSSGNVIKLKAYRVSPYLMAGSAVSNAIIYQTKTHSYVNSGEFINISGTKCYENMAWGTTEPFKTWYDAEKAGTFTTTAHYRQIISSSFTVTGANFNDLVSMSEQSFCSSSAGTTYSVSKFKKLFNAFIENKKAEIKETKKSQMAIFTTEPDYLTSARTSLNEAEEALVNTVKSYKPIVSVSNYSYCKLKISYSIPKGYDGIKIYRSKTGKSGSFKLITTKTSGKYTVDKGLNTGTEYYYKVRLYKTINGTNVTSKLSDASSASPKPIKVKGLKLTKTNNGELKVKWTAVNGADGYRVYVRKAGETKFKLLKTNKNIKGLILNKRKIDSLKAICTVEESGTYVIRVRAYRIVDGKKIYGEYSVMRKIKL